MPQLLSNSVIEGLRVKRNELVAEYQEKLGTFKPSYPMMIQIENRIKEIDRQLATEVTALKASYKAGYESSLNQENEMKALIETLKAEVLDLQKRMIQYNILKREAETNRNLYNGLLQRYKEIDVAGGAGSNNVFIIDRAEVPGAPSSPRVGRALLLSLALGLGMGLGAAYLLERFDDTIKSADEVERLTGLPTLGIISKLRADQTIESELADPRSALSEAYRSLCTSLQFSTESGLPKTLLVTSASPTEGKSVTAMAIATHFAKLGLQVLLVDADLRNASLHVKLGRDNAVGLSNYLTGSCSPPETLQATVVPNSCLHGVRPPPSQCRGPSGRRAVVVATFDRARSFRPHCHRWPTRDGISRCPPALQRDVRDGPGRRPRTSPYWPGPWCAQALAIRARPGDRHYSHQIRC